MSDICLICFFFQAEDGIRDRNVTGVQTCALPISILGLGELAFRRGQDAFEANENNVADDEGPHIVRAAAHEFLLELDDSVANRAFHFAFTPTFFHEPYITHGDTQKTYQVWA